MKSEKYSMIETDDFSAVARRLRGEIIKMSHHKGVPHLGCSLSCVDILVAAYWGVLKIDPQDPTNPNRDRFIFSKGHAASALYAALAYRGFFPTDFLNTLGDHGSVLAEHPLPKSIPGLELATGSLGHGLSVGAGIALAGRIQGRDYRTYVLISDGECNEGSVWEAAMFAAGQRLENLTVVVDYNKWQATDRSEDVLALKPLREKWHAFGWEAYEIDGHKMSALLDCMKNVPNVSKKPTAIIAHTVKGRGISFMEDDNNWHYRIPNAEEFQMALKELGPL